MAYNFKARNVSACLLDLIEQRSKLPEQTASATLLAVDGRLRLTFDVDCTPAIVDPTAPRTYRLELYEDDGDDLLIGIAIGTWVVEMERRSNRMVVDAVTADWLTTAKLIIDQLVPFLDDGVL